MKQKQRQIAELCLDDKEVQFVCNDDMTSAQMKVGIKIYRSNISIPYKKFLYRVGLTKYQMEEGLSAALLNVPIDTLSIYYSFNIAPGVMHIITRALHEGLTHEQLKQIFTYIDDEDSAKFQCLSKLYNLSSEQLEFINNGKFSIKQKQQAMLAMKHGLTMEDIAEWYNPCDRSDSMRRARIEQECPEIHRLVRLSDYPYNRKLWLYNAFEAGMDVERITALFTSDAPLSSLKEELT